MATTTTSFKCSVEGYLVPSISLFGLLGNGLTLLVLNNRHVKLKWSLVQILCGLAIFDNVFLVFVFSVFTLPCLSQSYYTLWFPYMVPYLLPATNTLMTCSVYATVAVAINRFAEMSPRFRMPYWLESGKTQLFIVLLISVIFNISRWCELEFYHDYNQVNITRENETWEMVNKSAVRLRETELRKSASYVRWYSLLATSAVMNIFPAAVMVYCSCQVNRRLREVAGANLSSDIRLRARMKRNRSITRTLFGIIIMFVLCHTGKIIISIYEVVHIFVRDFEVPFEPWACNLIVVNTLLVVLNSSTNFVFYCGDVVFRQCLTAIPETICGCGSSSSTRNNGGCRQSSTTSIGTRENRMLRRQRRLPNSTYVSAGERRRRLFVQCSSSQQLETIL